MWFGNRTGSLIVMILKQVYQELLEVLYVLLGQIITSGPVYTSLTLQSPFCQ
jgi:hypothetical protein